MSGVLTGPLVEKTRQRFQKGGLTPPVPGEEIVRAIVKRNIFGNSGDYGAIPDGQSFGERYGGSGDIRRTGRHGERKDRISYPGSMAPPCARPEEIDY